MRNDETGSKSPRALSYGYLELTLSPELFQRDERLPPGDKIIGVETNRLPQLLETSFGPTTRKESRSPAAQND